MSMCGHVFLIFLVRSAYGHVDQDQGSDLFFRKTNLFKNLTFSYVLFKFRRYYYRMKVAVQGKNAHFS